MASVDHRAIAVSVSSSLIISLLYGAAYQSSASVLAIHIFAVVPVFLGVSSNLWLTNEKRGNLGIKQTMLGAGVNVLMNLYLIPMFGSTGAAISTVVSQVGIRDTGQCRFCLAIVQASN